MKCKLDGIHAVGAKLFLAMAVVNSVAVPENLILAIVWHPNAKWEALDEGRKLEYLKTLDDYILRGRAAGAIVLGWSKIDNTLPKAPREGFIGVFGVDSAEQLHAFEEIVGEAKWYDYFDSTNIGINLEGATASEPHKIYARLLGVRVD